MKSQLESQIDGLYQLPLDEFTKARHSLAKTLSSSEKTAVTSLVKPSLPMWVVNHLYWDNPSTYKALVDASEKLRTAHRSALTGRDVDTRKPEELHKATLEKAFTQAVAGAQKKGIRLTDATRDVVRRTLAALPTDEPPGRITREPPAAGFSLLTGIRPQPTKPQGLSPSDRKGGRPQPAPSAAELKRQKQAAQQAERIRKAAERSARLAEEKARKEREKRDREIAKAEQALRDAERRLADLKR